jgi:hypothetical protein
LFPELLPESPVGVALLSLLPLSLLPLSEVVVVAGGEKERSKVEATCRSTSSGAAFRCMISTSLAAGWKKEGHAVDPAAKSVAEVVIIVEARIFAVYVCVSRPLKGLYRRWCVECEVRVIPTRCCASLSERTCACVELCLVLLNLRLEMDRSGLHWCDE